MLTWPINIVVYAASLLFLVLVYAGPSLMGFGDEDIPPE